MLWVPSPILRTQDVPGSMQVRRVLKSTAGNLSDVKMFLDVA